MVLLRKRLFLWVVELRMERMQEAITELKLELILQ